MPPSSQFQLSTLVPVFNEEDTVLDLLEKVEACSVVDQIVVVDDGSIDGSAEKLSRWRAESPDSRVLLSHEKTRGKGAAIATALRAAAGEYVIIQDADHEYDPADIEGLFAVMKEQAPMAVYGSRLHAESKGVFPYPGHKIGNRFFTALTNLASGGVLELTDMATCYKLLARETVLALKLEEEGFGFDPEITLKIARAGGVVVECPVRYQGRRRQEGKKLHYRHGWEYLRCVLCYRVTRKKAG